MNNEHDINVYKFTTLCDLVTKICESNVDDKTKYECIFNDYVYKQIISLGIPLIDYEDPNGTYKEDISAFVESLEKTLAEIQKQKFKIV